MYDELITYDLNCALKSNEKISSSKLSSSKFSDKSASKEINFKEKKIDKSNFKYNKINNNEEGKKI